MKEDGNTVEKRYSLNPQSRLSIFANEVVPNSAFSTKVESTSALLVERSMYFGHDGHSSPGVNGGSRNWYLPEGFTGKGTDTWILLMNPENQAANATVTFMKEDGSKVEAKLYPQTYFSAKYLHQSDCPWYILCYKYCRGSSDRRRKGELF